MKLGEPRVELGFLLLLLLGHLGASAAVSTDGDCGDIPYVPGVNQEASDPSQYGKCTAALDPHVTVNSSNWCKFNALGYWPAGPSRLAKKCMKFGRMTVYRGPIYGSGPTHKGACRVDLSGSNATAVVAVSTKYLKTLQHGWVEDKGVCGECMCIHIRGVDDKYNPGVNHNEAKPYFGLTFLGKVGDRCGECEDEHIDVLLDRPFSYAPYNPENTTENPHAKYVNSLPGPRGFANPWAMRGGATFSPEAVGTWVTDWQWVPCKTSSHDTCAGLMRKMGYSNVWTPMPTPAVDSIDMTRVSEPIVPVPWTSDKPRKVYPTHKATSLGQCGGKAGSCNKVQATYQCEDQEWAECPAGHKCVRQNEWYWGCQPQQAS